MAELPALTPLDVCAGVILGASDGIGSLKPADASGTPREALEAVLLRALARPPCLVSFSGGRDSSAMLAVATLVARSEGLPIPVPITVRFPDAESAEETAWQEMVVAHLGLEDWQRVTVYDEMDVLGELATSILRRHGLLYPYNSHLHYPLLEAASGGVLVTGVGGDELLDGGQWSRAAAVLFARRARSAKDLAWGAIALAPSQLRRAFVGWHQPLDLPWLRPPTLRAVKAQAKRWIADQPIRADKRIVDWWWRSRYLRFGLQALDVLASDAGATVVHPFTDPQLLAAIAASCGGAGYADRASATRQLFGDVLPVALLERKSKADFSPVVFNRHSRAFVRDWSGEGVDEDRVDSAVLGELWRGDSFDSRTMLLLQSAWLQTVGAERGSSSAG